jgi:predicted nucleic acid-binding protein
VKYLVDANILSEATKARPSPAVVEWLGDNDPEIAVNPIILGELEYGILQLPAGRRRQRLEQWFQGGPKRLVLLELDIDTATVWARLLAELKRKGRAMPIKDSLIVATARQYGLTVATRNSVDFQHAGVALVNPFQRASK